MMRRGTTRRGNASAVTSAVGNHRFAVSFRPGTVVAPFTGGCMQGFSPHLGVLPEAQGRLWAELCDVPDEFTLYGGTAIALQLGHRPSVYFDFFGCRAVDVIALERGIPFLGRADVVQREKNTLTAIVDRGAPVKVSFVGLPRLPRLAPPVVADDNGLKVASLLDLAGTKALVVQVRGAAQDYLDIDALIHLGGVSLSFALAAARRLYGRSFNPQITLKALSYFYDGDLLGLPEDVKARLAQAVKEVELDRLPTLRLHDDPDHGVRP
jgi:Nucleotidyl transferase AbiEii toxin, Type IV TA system